MEQVPPDKSSELTVRGNHNTRPFKTLSSLYMTVQSFISIVEITRQVAGHGEVKKKLKSFIIW